MQKIDSWIKELKKRNLEADLLNKLASMLHRCQTIEDIQNQIGQFIFRIYMEQPGELFLLNEKKQILEKSSTWGEIHGDPTLIRKEYCLSLDQNKLCSFQNGVENRCQFHQTLAETQGEKVQYICAPLFDQDRIIGMLHQHLPEESHLFEDMQWLNDEHWEHLARAITEHLSSSITTIKLRQKLRPQALRDPLTQLFNRWYMEETLEREIYYAKRHSVPLWLYYLDIDRMKSVNERHGYGIGDEVLRNVSHYLQRHTRAEDVVCRSGGDEFTLILLGIPDDSALMRAQSLRTGIKELQVKTYDLFPVETSCSFGLSCYPHHGESATDLFQAADRALYQAKSDGRDLVRVA